MVASHGVFSLMRGKIPSPRAKLRYRAGELLRRPRRSSLCFQAHPELVKSWHLGCSAVRKWWSSNRLESRVARHQLAHQLVPGLGAVMLLAGGLTLLAGNTVAARAGAVPQAPPAAQTQAPTPADYVGDDT